MSPEELEARQRILQAAIQMINEADEPERLTIRQIAARAGVGIGLINYHFRSKEALLKQAIDAAAGDMADQWERSIDTSIADPVERLKALLKTNARVALGNPKFLRIGVLYELLEGDFSVPQILLPLLREISGHQRDEQDLRMLAFTLITTMQVLFIRERPFRKYAGIHVYDEAQRDRAIDRLVDQMLFGCTK